MENTTDHKPKKDNTILFYILGGVVVTAVIIAGFLMYRPQQPAPDSQPVLGQEAPAQPTAMPAAKAISTLACSSQFYNTVNGVPQNYYLSTEGEAPTGVTSVTCTITASVNNQVVATEKVTPNLQAEPSRGGSTFRCTTNGIKLTPNVSTKVTTDIADSAGNSVTCSRAFLLP